ncbi:MAG: dTDP-4-amino-4,6-dideoxygalactose transaminase [Candidatus Calescibacterium sp.]|nr:dTDP-4-amino-4,6-dideoxygalactose transaminase [Candidatus Calescibacterium sp.]MCX7733822.1 dTDP-4-amino-4,6-dideoxygalactose transaminase [bacterium]MDW8086972.1 dTDP-4-amino-4,6-dideoxygalactose transaminase [Candidatus Calescibacterium sp.]
MISFNRPTYTGNEDKYVVESIRNSGISSDGKFVVMCQEWFEKNLPCLRAFLTPSCTAALEMCAMLINIREGDEVIMPSFTSSSTANAFVLRGAKIVFVDIRPDTMNIDETLVESAITEKTKAIVVVHYAGVSCEMKAIMDIANKYNLFVIEDAAHAMMSKYDGKSLGTIGHLGCYSFHETKNYTSAGEGGLLIINDERFVERSEIIRQKGTNRSNFFKGLTDKYFWVDIGGSYTMSNVSAAYLWGQLELADMINQSRLINWNLYYQQLESLQKEGKINLPYIPPKCIHNGHIFYIKLRDSKQRAELIEYMKNHKVLTAFHYVPLHSSPAGKKFGRFVGEDRFTTKESERLLRLPMFFGLTQNEIIMITELVRKFFHQ